MAKSLKSYSKSTSIKVELGVSRVQTRVGAGRDTSTSCTDFTVWLFSLLAKSLKSYSKSTSITAELAAGSAHA